MTSKDILLIKMRVMYKKVQVYVGKNLVKIFLFKQNLLFFFLSRLIDEETIFLHDVDSLRTDTQLTTGFDCRL